MMGTYENKDDNVKKMGKDRKSKTPTLDLFGKDLVDLARKGKLDPVFGREEEIDKIVQILNKRKKNNPMLVGESGVGKCICADTQVVIRNDITGEIKKITIKDFLNTLT